MYKSILSCSYRYGLLITFIFALYNTSISQPGTHFSKVFSYGEDNDGDAALRIIPYEDGYLINGGRKNNLGVEYAALAQIDQQGELLWKNSYYLENQESPPDAAWDFVVVDSLIFIPCHYSQSENEQDLQLLCINLNNHDTVWTKSYPHTTSDYSAQILRTPDNALVLISQAVDVSTGKNQLRLTKISLQGEKIWDHFFNNFKTFNPQQACLSSDGNILVAYSGFLWGEFSQRAAISKFDLNGDLIWTRLFPTTDIPALTVASIANFPDGRIALGWVKDTFPPGGTLYQFPPTIWILDDTGNIQNTYSFHHYFNRKLHYLRVMPDGDLIGAGIAEENPDSFGTGGWIFRMSPQGELRWQKTVFDNVHSLMLFSDATYTPQGDIIACGYILESDPIYRTTAWIFKMGGDGCYNGDCNNTQLILTPTGEPDNSPYSEYRIYPNPVQNWINIEGRTGDEEEEYHIYSTDGRLIRRCIPTDVGQIDVGDLPAGSYFLQILCPKRNNRNITSLLFIKQP